MNNGVSTASSKQVFYDFLQFSQVREDTAQAFPYTTRISLVPLIQHLRFLSRQGLHSESTIAQTLLEKIEERPILTEPEVSPEEIARHQDILALILSVFFNPLLGEPKMGYILSPFSNHVLCATADFIDIIKSGEYEISLDIDKSVILKKMLANACNLILSKLYERKLRPVFPDGFTIRHKVSGLEKHFEFNAVPNFVEVAKIKPFPPISPAQIDRLHQKPFEPEEWLKIFPPDHFEFSGILIMHLTDVTKQEAKARIKNRMLGREMPHPEQEAEYIRTQIRSFFQTPDLEIGFQQPGHMLRQLMAASGKLPALLSKTVSREAFDQSAYGQVKAKLNALIVGDLKKANPRGEVEEALLDQGLRSLMLIPILHKGESNIHGILELASPKPGALSHLHLTKIRGLLPIFSASIERKQEELDNRMRRIIQDQFTNIHNSVQWKFTKASRDLLRRQLTDPDKEHQMAPLVFPKVYPLYGQADIVHSSDSRNTAILGDLSVNLDILAKLLNKLYAQSPNNLIDFFREKVKSALSDLEAGFSPNDETRILNLLKQDIHPYLRELERVLPAELQLQVNAYFEELHPPLGVIYRKRKAYEESVAMLNEAISKLVHGEDEEMQAILPHYFEKYKTDGVEYNIYLGQSILENRQFSENYLREFRLWQLILMVRITRLVKKIQSKLPLPLTTAQLIFVYSDSLDIRFRMDEKRFDVDGAYNVRYEILKNRIDKAYVRDVNERLTQAGKIAIVYLHPENRREYLEYLDYLLQKGYIEPEIENLPLADMQGVAGLKALRVTPKL